MERLDYLEFCFIHSMTAGSTLASWAAAMSCELNLELVDLICSVSVSGLTPALLKFLDLVQCNRGNSAVPLMVRWPGEAGRDSARPGGTRRECAGKALELAQVSGRCRVALGGGKAIPPLGFGEVLRHATAAVIANAQVVLRGGIALGRGVAIPHYGFRVILRGAKAPVAADAQAILRRRVALFGGEIIPFHGFLIIPRRTPAVLITRTEGKLRHGVAALGPLQQ